MQKRINLLVNYCIMLSFINLGWHYSKFNLICIDTIPNCHTSWLLSVLRGAFLHSLATIIRVYYIFSNTATYLLVVPRLSYEPEEEDPCSYHWGFPYTKEETCRVSVGNIASKNILVAAQMRKEGANGLRVKWQSLCNIFLMPWA